MSAVTSAANPRYRALLKLAHSSRERRKAGLSLLDGIHLAGAYLERIGSPEQIAVSVSACSKPEVSALLAAAAPVEPLLLSDALFRELSTVATPTGVLLAVKTPRPAPMPAEGGACILLDGVQDPGNLGSILRSAAAAAVGHVFLSADSAQAWSPRVLRAGMGAHFMLKIYERVDLAGLVDGFRGRIIAAVQSAPHSIFSTDLRGSVALLFGSEGGGVSPALLARAHAQAAIPMPGGGDSLNVAAAAAVCLFERVRQEGAGVHR